MFSTQKEIGPNLKGQKELKSMKKRGLIGLKIKVKIENLLNNTFWLKNRPPLGPSISGIICARHKLIFYA